MHVFLFLICSILISFFREVYEMAMTEETIPEIQRTSLGHVILYLKTMGIHDVLGYVNLTLVIYVYCN